MRRGTLCSAVVLLLAACGPASVSGPSAAAPTATSDTSPSAVTTEAAPASASASATPTGSEQAVTAVALSEDGDTPRFVIRRESGFFALGGQHVWASDDGLAWEVAEASAPDGEVARLVERGDGTLLAFGSAGDTQEPGVFRTWTSDDGLAWEAAQIGLPEGFILLGLARGELGYVLIGRAIDDVRNAVQLWFSPDAISWEVVYEATQDEALAAVGAGPEGFVVVGQQGFQTGSPRALVRASADGREWTSATDGAALVEAGSSLWSVAPLQGDWVAASNAVGAEMSILFSPNGLDWQERTSVPVPPEDEGSAPGLISSGSRLFLARPYMGEQAAAPPLLTSLDGIVWSETDIPLTAWWNFATADGVDVFLVEGTMHTYRE